MSSRVFLCSANWDSIHGLPLALVGICTNWAHKMKGNYLCSVENIFQIRRFSSYISYILGIGMSSRSNFRLRIGKTSKRFAKCLWLPSRLIESIALHRDRFVLHSILDYIELFHGWWRWIVGNDYTFLLFKALGYQSDRKRPDSLERLNTMADDV